MSGFYPKRIRLRKPSARKTTSVDTALDMLIPIILGLMLGTWLHNRHGWGEIWIVLFAVLGMVVGLWTAWKRSRYKMQNRPPQKPAEDKEENPTAESPLKNWQPYPEKDIKDEYDEYDDDDENNPYRP